MAADSSAIRADNQIRSFPREVDSIERPALMIANANDANDAAKCTQI
jgi:hypothetical protein